VRDRLVGRGLAGALRDAAPIELPPVADTGTRFAAANHAFNPAALGA
jgi:hypothetical protein